VLAADILVIAGRIWLGDNSSETKKSLSVCKPIPASSTTRPWLYYGKSWLASSTALQRALQPAAHRLQHRSAVRRRVDRGGRPGPSYGDVLSDGRRVGLDNEFTNRNTTFMTGTCCIWLAC